MREVLILSAVMVSISFTVSETKLFARVRAWTVPRSSWAGHLVGCGYCLGHLIAFVLMAVYQPRLLCAWYPLDIFVTALLVAWLAGIQWATLCALLVAARKQVAHLSREGIADMINRHGFGRPSCPCANGVTDPETSDESGSGASARSLIWRPATSFSSSSPCSRFLTSTTSIIPTGYSPSGSPPRYALPFHPSRASGIVVATGYRPSAILGTGILATGAVPTATIPSGLIECPCKGATSCAFPDYCCPGVTSTPWAHIDGPQKVRKSDGGTEVPGVQFVASFLAEVCNGDLCSSDGIEDSLLPSEKIPVRCPWAVVGLIQFCKQEVRVVSIHTGTCATTCWELKDDKWRRDYAAGGFGGPSPYFLDWQILGPGDCGVVTFQDAPFLPLRGFGPFRGDFTQRLVKVFKRGWFQTYVVAQCYACEDDCLYYGLWLWEWELFLDSFIPPTRLSEWCRDAAARNGHIPSRNLDDLGQWSIENSRHRLWTSQRLYCKELPDLLAACQEPQSCNEYTNDKNNWKQVDCGSDVPPNY